MTTPSLKQDDDSDTLLVKWGNEVVTATRSGISAVTGDTRWVLRDDKGRYCEHVSTGYVERHRIDRAK